MGRDKDASSGGNKGKDGLAAEDFQLWKAFTRDIAPLHPESDGPHIAGAKPAAARDAAGVTAGRNTIRKQIVPPPACEQAADLDLRTELRLRRGKMPIEGRLDLHGCTQAQAHRMLEGFLTSAHAAGKRCVLVITGKGKSQSPRDDAEPAMGVLRRKLPQWLDMPALKSIVLKATPAVQRDGGAGAWYIYLRRQR